MTAAELERLILRLDARELSALGAFVAALRSPVERSPADLRASLAWWMACAPPAHLAAVAAAAEALTG